MESININTLINFAASVLIFGAAVIPIVLSIWREAKEANEKDKIIRNTLITFNILSAVTGVFFNFIDGLTPAVLISFFICFSLNCMLFILTKTPYDKLFAVVLIIHGLIISNLYQFFYLTKVISLLGQLVNKLQV